MSTPTSRRPMSSWVGILAGLVLLGLVAAFAIGLPKVASADDSAPAPVQVSLPDTLPGGYAAADLEQSFAGTKLADQGAAIAEQQAASTKYGNTVLPEVLGAPAVTRSYINTDTSQAVFVQVFTSDGGALAPGSMTDPTTTQGAGGLTLAAVGDGVCILTYGQSTDGTTGDPTQAQCQVSQGGHTVQIQGAGAVPDDLVSVADGILAGLSQDQ